MRHLGMAYQRERGNTFTPGGLSPSTLFRTLRKKDDELRRALSRPAPKPDMAQAAFRGRAQHAAWAQRRGQGRMRSSPSPDFETAFRRGSIAPAPSQYRSPPSRAPVMRRGGLAPRYRPTSISRRGGYARHYVSNQVAPRGFRGIDLSDKKTIALLGVAAVGLYFVFTSG